MTDAAPIAATGSSMRRDIASAYLVTFSRVASWAILSAIIYRKLGHEPFALFVLTRATLGLLNYAAVGLGPAMVRLLAEARASEESPAPIDPTSSVLSYESPRTISVARNVVYASGLAWSCAVAIIGIALVFVCGLVVSHTSIGYFDTYSDEFVVTMGFGIVLRVISDASGAVLQTAGKIRFDNYLLAAAEWAWVLAVVLMSPATMTNIAYAFFLVSGAMLFVRYIWANTIMRIGFVRWMSAVDATVVKRLLAFGVLISLAQLADYLYAPTDYLLISALLHPSDVATYAPAVQLDAALLLIVSGLATVLLPHSAVAHTRGDVRALRSYYVRGTLASIAMLIVGATVVYFGASKIFRVWLGNDMRPTQFILPFVLIHTVIGGSSAVGRSILLGMGKVKPFTMSVLIAGVSNAMLSYIFVRFFDLGLRGIIYGTILAVVGRCAIWMPWYVLRTLAREHVPSLAAAGNPNSHQA